MTYKGYTGRVTDVDPETGELYGEVTHILGVITFIASTGPDLVREFHTSVDGYLKWCEKRGVEPVKPYSGKFQTRIPPALHKNAAREARLAGVSLNAFVQAAIQAAVVEPAEAKAAAAKPIPAAARAKAKAKARKKPVTAKPRKSSA